MTLTEQVQRTLRKNRWFTASDIASTVYNDPQAGDQAARRIRALREQGVTIEKRLVGGVTQYRRV